ncbi:hypothetical protein D3C78_1989630 [compost metagenome]
MLQTRLVDEAIEALAEHLIKQVGNLIAAVAAVLGHLLQVQLRVQVGPLALKVMLKILRHGAQLTR